jgi:hypothetical protein
MPHQSTTRTWDMDRHTCGGKGHFKRECPNRKLVLVNEETNEYETGDDADPDCSDDDDFGHDDVDAILPPPTTLFARCMCLMCPLHLKVSDAICSKLKHLLDRTNLANSSSMVVVATTLLAKSCVPS